MESGVSSDEGWFRSQFEVRIALHAVALAIWVFLLTRFREGDVYQSAGPYALFLIAVVCVLRWRALGEWLRPTLPGLVSGVLMGAGMTLLTYPAFRMATWLIPPLETQVRSLYSGAYSSPVATALPWTMALVVAEELIFRGSLLETLELRMSTPWAAATSVLIYTVAQYGTGSWIVSLLALCCGSVWMLQRVWTRSLISPLIAHAIWTPTVILLHPVISSG